MTLEELLNKLIEKGWKPFKKDWQYTKKEDGFIYLFYECKYVNEILQKTICFRELVSKESGLWQFCVENDMVEMAEGFYRQNIFPLDSIEYEYVDYQYWIIESALCDEDKLEQFLLDNINIEG